VKRFNCSARSSVADDSASAMGIGDDWRCWEEARTQGSWPGCHGGDARYDPALVPRTGGEEVRWQRQTRPGRPGTVTGVIRLLVRMARENPSWGYTRLRGALKNIGHELGRNTIKRILQEQGIDPAPTRKRRYSWERFIRAHLAPSLRRISSLSR